jgi:hypothetical protein
MAIELPLKLRKRGFYIVNTTENCIYTENDFPKIFATKEEAEKFLKENNIIGVVK